MKKLFFWLSILVAAWGYASIAQAAGDAQLLSKIANLAAKPEAMSANFTQTKQIKGFRSPAVSSGNIILARQKGMLWRTLTPFQSVLKITETGIVETQGNQVNQIASGQGLKNVTKVMSSLLSGDFSDLQQYFSYTGSIQSKSWVLHLTPKDSQMSRKISNIQLSGDSFVKRAVIYETNGDVSTIVFTNTRAISANGLTF
ncbi:LolA family protein [Hydromonas duriensis]|uniref:Outer membrane lipoprotein-sorting protein n=1 Tax=Hydromonas duriensis TaxID=1527608 RepID=A0A4R6Y5W1_9BURK|nr:outer membrane lipoprotein carrier protein LolA [Hydromonas duriensis]TDR30752.1 outer membrane lipoprotein-sorting protein [Hydromonas duriensis]